MIFFLSVLNYWGGVQLNIRLTGPLFYDYIIYKARLANKNA